MRGCRPRKTAVAVHSGPKRACSANPVISMSAASEPRGRHRSSIQLLADVLRGPERVAPDEMAQQAGRRLRRQRRRALDTPDPTLTEDERTALEEAVDSMRGELTNAKLIGPKLGSEWARQGPKSGRNDSRVGPKMVDKSTPAICDATKEMVLSET